MFLLTIPCTGERTTNFTALLTNGGTVGTWDISISFFYLGIDYGWACSAKYAWYAFQPGHQQVCQRHSRAIKVFGLASAFFRMGQVSQPKVFSNAGVLLVFMAGSFYD